MGKLTKTIVPFLLTLLLLGAVYYFSTIVDLPAPEKKIKPVNSYVSDSGTIQLYFCPREDCETAFVQFLDSAQQSLHCALYEVELESVKEKLLEKEKIMDVKVVTDSDYFHQFNYSFVQSDSWGLMHNKFCIIDGKKVSTGSMNPTDNDAHKNNNNLLFIESSVLAGNYEDEFQEMWNGTFKKGNAVKNPNIKLGGINLQNSFCPEDHCADRVKDELKKAQKSIYFMTFSFTNEGIANIILLKKLENITIQGVMEARQVTEYSKYQVLSYQIGEMNIIKDNNKNNMHHKVFIIDEETVITGSFNPTEGGDERNDENIMIIKDTEIARRFKEEFDFVFDSP
jgi:phosphatidylserine/phosphatidylglycerophosphate/cardiolipin synthase-like enzyme